MLSIIVPVWNREDTIERCLDSILAQSFEDYEIIAVEDASTDRSLEIMEGYDDPRIRIIRHEVNRGKNPARATGIGHARNGWLMLVDSDDALLPGALATIVEMVNAAPPGVGIVGMSYKYDDGTTGPKPRFPDGDVALQGWLEWVDGAERVDFLKCFRREVLEEIPMPTDGRGSMQMMMRIAAGWRIRATSTPGGMVYTDAANRLSVKKKVLLPPKAKLALAIEGVEILREFGDKLRAHSPRLYRRVSYNAGWWYLLSGHRLKGAMRMLRYLLRWPLEAKTWGWLALGIIGPKALHWALTRRSGSE